MWIMRGKGGGESPNLVMFWGFLMLISNNLFLIPIASASQAKSFGDEKNYYFSPDDPHPPSGVPSNPSHSPSHHGSSTAHHPPSSSGRQSNCRVPSPSPPPNGGGGGCRCPSPPSHSGGSGGRGGGGGGGYYHPPLHVTPPSPLVPSPPFEPPVTPTPRPSTPPPRSGGGGGYYGPPTPSTPTTPSSPLVPSPPVSPVMPSPLVPRTPSPLPFDPNSLPFPCTYWGSHPSLIFGVVGWWATVGGLFGVTTLPGLSSADTTLQQVLNNPRRDGYSSLYREGIASLLNSMATRNFPFSSEQVRASLLASLHSDRAAAARARIFRLANEGKRKASAASTSTAP